VQLRAGQPATEDELKVYCKDKIAHFKIPQSIWFVEEFPMTVTGKLQKFRMRELALERIKAGPVSA
jgi:fatty-acyl-CoA synthase